MKTVKLKPSDITPQDGMKAAFDGFITSIIACSMLACLLVRLPINTLSSAILLGLSIWFGFVATLEFGGILWERKPFSWFHITTSYEAVAYGLSGAILYYFV